eukprot:COSAG06_NODE_10302_length_1707_cov_1.855100_2_plen_402_part_01
MMVCTILSNVVDFPAARGPRLRPSPTAARRAAGTAAVVRCSRTAIEMRRCHRKAGRQPLSSHTAGLLRRRRQSRPSSAATFTSNDGQPPGAGGPQGPRAPRRIVLIRHGESQGNVDETAYVRTADWRIPLTERGRQQAAQAGRKLRDVLGERPTMWYVSPYVRTQQTLSELIKQSDARSGSNAGGSRGGTAFSASAVEEGGYLSLGIREEPRIAEQQFGNFQNVEEVLAAKEERLRFGRFWYRFPNGESGLDVYNRTTSFIATIFRDMRAIQHALGTGSSSSTTAGAAGATGVEHDSSGSGGAEYNVVIVTHGLTLRLFLMRWLRWSVTQFETSHNPPNAAVIVMERRQDSSGSQWFALAPESAQLLNIGAENVFLMHRFILKAIFAQAGLGHMGRKRWEPS